MFLYAVWCALTLTLCSLESFRVLQNGNYLPWRGYFKVVASWYFVSLCFLCAFSALWNLYFPYPFVLCGTYTLASIPMVFARHKSKLKFTKRVVRMIVVEFVLLIFACRLLLFVWSVLLPLFVVFSWLICLPLDALINRYYISMARKKLANSGVVVIGITGSFGKTSTKSILSTLLSGSIAPLGSCNTPLGIANFINCTDLSAAKFLILEFGARKCGDISQLCKFFPPQHGIITGVCPQHLRTFGNFENVVSEKGKLVEFLPRDGICVLAHESALRYLKYGQCVKVLPVVQVSDLNVCVSGVGFTAKFENQTETIKLPQISPYSTEIFSACATLCLKLGQSFAETVENSKFVRQCPHRLEVLNNGKFYIIDDSYNASVEGIQACYDVLRKLSARKIVISQGVVECGREARKINFEVGKKLGAVCDVFISCGKNKNELCLGAENSHCPVAQKVGSLHSAVEFAGNYVCKDCVLLFQNDLPDVVNV